MPTTDECPTRMAIEFYEDVGAYEAPSGNQDGTTREKEPKSCPFCHAEMEFTPDELRPDGVWQHPRGNCILQGTRITGDNVPDWNRRTDRRLSELSDTERKEAGYPVSREELVEVLRLASDMESNDYNVTDRHIVITRIRDILSREENHD